MFTAPAPDPDLPLVRAAQAGDMEAFDEIIRRYQSLMSALLHRFSPARADLEDLVQETFVKAWRALPEWQPERPFAHWLKRIAVRTGLEFYRRRQHSPFSRLQEPSAEGRDPLDDLPAETPDAAQGALEEAQFILSHLPPEDRALLTLLHLEQMPLAEIAQHFGWSRINAKVKAFRARQRLQTLLKRHGYELP
ncbi:RNA polymerase sigma-70 factor, ECF subfamily [Prosthecobacter debontii]|uniref:RNA polymerase sigma-70 factor, ECF subfamily n=1 Tax=Prosthecobacter debontii TaxID=48467 RepID=A0A1T4Z361_9BACT|nr:sigma-70 family RNA polymerase sigma factor [Prosthecobacter debontii]SKB08464.1 RNA polymerase sigma-70 factor, ECF subfamily [Prosthecobacter debontii]